jgi:esterase/lipase superfamily enzyme
MDPKVFDEVLALAARKTWRPAKGGGPVISIHLETAPGADARQDVFAAFERVEDVAKYHGVSLALTGGGYGCVSFEIDAKASDHPDQITQMVEGVLFQSAVNQTGATSMEVGRVADPVRLHRFYGREVAYLTNRAPERETDYGDESGEVLYAGTARVYVPSEPSPPRNRADQWLRIRNPFQAKLKVLPVVEALSRMSPEDLVSRLVGQGQAALLNIHGVRTSFHDALVDSAELARNLQLEKLDLASIAFCWPASLDPKYLKDANFAERSGVALAKSLAALGENLPALNALAYSHGAKLLLEAAREFKASGYDPGGAFDRVIFVAPDADEVVTSQRLAHLMDLFQAGALYYNNADNALNVAGKVAGGKRAGAHGPATAHPRLECIDVSDIADGLVGHSYHAESPQVCDDIFGVLKHDPVSGRRGPVEQAGRPGFYAIRRMPQAAKPLQRA